MDPNNGPTTTIVYARGRFDHLLLLLLTLSLGGNIGLGYQLMTNGAKGRGSVVDELTIGTRLPALEVRRLDGQREQISYGLNSPETVLYVFAPACKWCQRNLDNVRVVAAAARAKGLRFIGISLDGEVLNYLDRVKLDFPVYVSPAANTIQTYKLGRTPETLVVSADGRLVRHWSGAYDGRSRAEIETWLGRPLPGLID